jgi:hypothetical protein
MSRSWIIAAGTMALVLAGSSAVCAAERTEDPPGDVIGDAPDIVAVTFSQPEDEPRVSVSIEFAEDPPLETDMETYTDVVFIHLDVDPETIQTIQFETEDDEYDYIIGTHAVQLPIFVESGGMLYETAGLSEVHENVVDVEVDGTTITWTVDLALIGDPDMISWAVLAGVEMDDAEEMAFDVSPNEGEPWGLYVITPEAVAGTE